MITGTWQRHSLLLEAIDNVRQQTYRPLEHVIVSDGEDVALRGLEGPAATYPQRLDVPLRFAELGRQWSEFRPDSFAAAPLIAAQLLARGEYQTFLADDERMTPDHIESLVELLEQTGADFAYSKVSMSFVGRPDQTWVIGTDPPQCGQITNALYRSDILRHGLYPMGAGMTSDWSQFSLWQGKGARHAFLPRVTFSHVADH